MKNIYLYERAAQILLYLVNSYTFHTISDLQKITVSSNRSVRYDLDYIDEFLLSNKIQRLIRKPRVGISFNGNERDRERIKQLLANIEKYNYILSPDERVVMIILEFTEESDYITIKHLTQQLLVSRSTVNKDLKRVREILSKYNLKIEFVQRHGLKLIGEEKDIRRLLVQLWLDYIYKSLEFKAKGHREYNQIQLKRFMSKLKGDIDIPFVKNILNIIEKKLVLSYSDVAYGNILAHMCIALMRIKNGRYISLEIKDKEKLKSTKEFTVVKDFKEIFENYFKLKFMEDEIIYIAICLLGGNITAIDDESKGEWIYLQLLVKKVIELVNSKTIIDISQDWKLFNSLLEHIKPMINRIKYGIRLENPILKNIREDYQEFFKIVKESVYPIEEFVGQKVNDDEIGYLTIHFGAAIEREKISGIIKPKVLIVCDTGLGTSELLSVQIQSMFEVYIVGAIPKRKIEEALKTKEVDVIISTVPIKNEKNIKVINVKPILTEENIKKLNNIFLDFKSRKIEIGGLINVIERSCTINNRQQLEKDLYNIFNMKLINNIDGDDKPVLRDIITEETIKLNIEANNWEEAVRIAGGLLVKTEAVEEKYVEAMVSSVKELGPYIVIADGIAMPHARPESGALKVGMSLITLKNPVEFGDEECEPVKLIIAFSAVDSSTHLKALSQLMVLLEDEDAIDKILNSNNKKKILEIIDKFSD